MKEPFPNSALAVHLLRKAGDVPATRAVYCVAFSELPAAEFAWPGNGPWLAYTQAGLDTKLRDQLAVRRLWNGPGFATVVNDAALPAGDVTARFHCGLGILIHEYAHALQNEAHDNGRNCQMVRPYVQRRVKLDEDFMAYWLQTPRGDVFHSAVFLRAALHLHHRMEDLCPVTLADCHLAYPGLPDPESMRYALATELLAERQPIARLLTEQPPRTFGKLWREACSP